jgi:hypothetical protein
VRAATEAVQARAEILKLARLLRREPDELAYLETVPLDDLQALRAMEGALERLGRLGEALASP